MCVFFFILCRETFSYAAWNFHGSVQFERRAPYVVLCLEGFRRSQDPIGANRTRARIRFAHRLASSCDVLLGFLLFLVLVEWTVADEQKRPHKYPTLQQLLYDATFLHLRTPCPASPFQHLFAGGNLQYAKKREARSERSERK